jgi:hypothetical protein
MQYVTPQHESLALWLDVTDHWFPRHVTESAWLEHTPFAAWIISTLKPKVVVELGTHRAVSYMAFCQANAKLESPGKCYAVDTWEGDEHAGKYSEDIFNEVVKLNERYGDFSTLLRCRFDQALSQFQNGSIDLLHIDGLHTYEAVSEDFYSWLPKMSKRGVILFHDTEVRTGGFGVWRLWGEISQQYPHFGFNHGFGLGLLAVGTEIPQELSEFCKASTDPISQQYLRKMFEARGREISDVYNPKNGNHSHRKWWRPYVTRFKTFLKKSRKNH